MRAAKKPKTPAWSQPATPRAAVAIAELLKVRKEQAILSKKSMLLQQIIIDEHGGAAHGVRASIRRQRAGASWRLVRTKERHFVTFLKGESACPL